MDSNHDTQIQNLQCYRYTTRHRKLLFINYLQMTARNGQGFSVNYC